MLVLVPLSASLDMHSLTKVAGRAEEKREWSEKVEAKKSHYIWLVSGLVCRNRGGDCDKLGVHDDVAGWQCEG